MSRDGNGNFSLPEAAFVYDTVIDETAVNSNFSDIASALTASIAKDGQTTPSANLPMGTYRHTGVGNAVARTDYAAMGQVQDGAGIWCGTAGGTADALTLTPSPAISAYAAGQRFEFKAGGASNTGAVTFAISGLSTIAGQVNGAACGAGDIAANQWYRIVISDTSTAQIERIGVVAGGDVSGPASSTADALVLFNGTGGKTLKDSTYTITAAGAALLDDANAAAQRTTLGLAIGTDVQAYDATTMKTGAVQTMTKALRGSPVALTSSSGSIAMDASAGNYFSHTFTENTTLANPTNLAAGQSGAIAFTQHASSAKTLAFGAYWIEATTGTTPAVSTTTSSQNLLVYYVFDTTHIYYVLHKHGVT